MRDFFMFAIVVVIFCVIAYCLLVDETYHKVAAFILCGLLPLVCDMWTNINYNRRKNDAKLRRPRQSPIRRN